jgi:hypothetical protein
MGNPPERTGHPLGVTRKLLLGAALTTVGMGFATGVAAAEGAPSTEATAQSRPAPATDVRSMTDAELGAELGRVGGTDSLRAQEIVTELKQRGHQFWEAAPPTRGVGVSGAVPVRPGASVTGTLGYDAANGRWVTSGGVRIGKPGAPQFTGIAPKPDGLNAEANANARLGEYGEFSSRLTLNIAPDLSVTGSYRAKGTVTTPDGRSHEVEVTVERRADGTWHVDLPDGVTTGTPLPGGGSAETTRPADPTEEPGQPEVKGPAPTAPASPKSGFDWGAGLSVDKEFLPAPLPPPTAEEVDRARESYAREQGVRQERTESWMAQNRPEAVRREAVRRAEDTAAAAEAARREALPDRDQDGRPDQQDPTWNQNDTDPASTDLGDGPETGSQSSAQDTPDAAAPDGSGASAADSTADTDSTGTGTDSSSAAARSSADTSTSTGSTDSDTNTGSGSAEDGTTDTGGVSDSSSSTTDTDTTGSSSGSSSGSGSTDDGPASGQSDTGTGTDAGTGTGTGADTDTGTDSGADFGGTTDSDTSSGASTGDADGDGLSGSADATPNQNDTDPASTDVGDGPEGGAGYGGSTDAGDYGSDPGAGDCTCF